MNNRKKRLIRVILFSILISTISLCGWTQRFWKIGTRALGMGGAYVAVADDSLAAHWNPAGISFNQRYDISFSYGELAQQEGKPIQVLNDIKKLNLNSSIYDETNLSSAVDFIKSLDKESINVNGHAQLGFFSSGGSWAVGMLEWKGAIIKPDVDLQNVDLNPESPNFILNNTSQLYSQGIKGREYIFTFSYPILVRQLMIGFNVKYMQLYTYQTNTKILTDFENTIKARQLIKDSFTEQMAYGKAFSFDVGVLAELSTYLRVGLVGKNIRKPTFELDNDEKLQLEPQWRAGVAITPNPSTMISVDFDINKNKWGEENLEFRELAAGFEKWLFNYQLIIRGGGYYNLAAKERGFVYTAGGSVRMSTLFIDAAIAYQPHLNDVSFCIGSSVKF